MSNSNICLICGKTGFKNSNSFTKHIRVHNISSKDYYLFYINYSNGICECGKEIGFRSIDEGFPIRCRVCNNKYNPERIEKIKKTTMIRYGASNASQVDEFKEKRAQTNLKLYGVRHAMSNPEIMARCTNTWEKNYIDGHPGRDANIKEKKQKTCQEKYNTNNPSQVEEFKLKRIETNLERYGVEHAMSNPVIYKRSINAMFEKYGVEHAMNNPISIEKFKQTNLKNRGTEWPMQCPEVVAKISGSNSYRWVEDRVQRCTPYTIKFFEDTYRQLIRKEQNNIDPISNEVLSESAHLHHIDYDKKNDSRINLIFLNRDNHLRTNHNRDYWYSILSDINEKITKDLPSILLINQE